LSNWQLLSSVSCLCCSFFPTLCHHPLSGLSRLVHILVCFMLRQILHITEKTVWSRKRKSAWF
jgi:hypothetical protein